MGKTRDLANYPNEGVTLTDTQTLTNKTLTSPIITGLPASSVDNTPAGDIAATDVQAAINELDTEKTSSTTLASTANGEGASLVGIEDAGGYFTATNVEDALQELNASIGYGMIYGYISGFLQSNNTTDPNNDIDITDGSCLDSTNAHLLDGSAMTKQLDAAWAAGTNQGGLDTGTKAADTEYYIHAILKDSDNSVDYLFSTSRTAPTMPTGYTYFRNIGWCKTDGSSNIIGFVATESGGGGLIYQWNIPIQDADLSNTLTTTARLDALSVMTGSKVRPLSTAQTYDAASSYWALFTDPDTTDTAASVSAFHIRGLTSAVPSVTLNILTNTSRQIRARADIATVDNYRITTFGFEWSRK